MVDEPGTMVVDQEGDVVDEPESEQEKICILEGVQRREYLARVGMQEREHV